MSVAEKLKAEGRVEGRVEGRKVGREEGVWIGRIQLLEEFLEAVPTDVSILEDFSLESLTALHARLHADYEARFKRP